MDQKVPCYNEGCDGGFIVVYNAYSPDPTVGQREPCDVCHGAGFIFSNIH